MFKTVSTDEYIILPNPDRSDADFRRNNKGDINITGSVNHGNGVKERRGLLYGSGQSAVYDYLFDKNKYTKEEAQKWIENHKEVEKTMDSAIILEKQFNFIMPLQKGYDGDDGYYHIKFAISSAVADLEKDQMTENALNTMVAQAKGLSVDGSKLQGINIDDDHKKGLNAIIGPVTDAWLEKDQVWVDLRVRKEWDETIRDLVDSGVALGGSVYGSATEVLPDDGTGVRKINDVFIVRAALTDTPAAWDTRGTAQVAKSLCTGSLCNQITKSLEISSRGGGSIKKAIIDLTASYETIQGDIRDALKNKYGRVREGGYVSTPCYLRWTTSNEAIVSSDWDSEEYYQIPYSYDEEGNIVLENPVRMDIQGLTKALSDADWITKSNKPKNRGDNLTKSEIEIPEGVDLDKSIAEKIKAQGDKGKEFIKGLLGIDDTNPGGDPGGEPEPTEPTTDPEPDVDPADPGLAKTIQKMIDTATEPIQKELEEVKAENTELKKGYTEDKTKELKKTKDGLLKKSLDLHKKLDKNMTPEQESELVKEIKADLDTEHGVALVERDIKTMTKSLEKIPAHDLPFVGGENLKKSEVLQKNQEARDKLAQIGK